jgi:hypothetical protein
MQQDGTAWDLASMQPRLSRVDQFYVLFLFVVMLVILAKLYRVWRPAPPFRLWRRANDPAYRPKLCEIYEGLNLWQTFVLFVTILVLLNDTIQICDRLLSSQKVSVSSGTYYVRQEATLLATGVITASFVFIVRWHIHSRIRRLGNLVRSS